MKIRELLNEKSASVLHVSPDTLIHDCIEIMNRHRVGSLMIVEADDRVAGILTERDLLEGYHCCDNRPGICRHPARDLMTPAARLISVTADCALDSAMEKMTEHNVRHLPVFDRPEGSLIGVLAIGDIVRTLLRCAQKENKTIKQYMFGQEQPFATDHIPMV